MDISTEVQPSAGEGDGCLKAASAFAGASGESAEVFEPVEAAFDAVAELVEGAVVWPLHFAADLGGDDCLGSHGLDGGNDGGGVIAAVGHYDLGLAARKQRQSFGELRRLPGRETEGNRLAQAVGQQMNLGAQSTSGTPQGLVFAPFLRPVAAC